MRELAACPKCQAPRRPGAAACAQCGLAAALWDSFAATTPAHPELDPLWQALQESWEDEALHARFSDTAVSAGGLDIVAARYRQAQLARPGDARARHGLERAAMLAERLHLLRAESARPAATRLSYWVGVLAAALICGAAFWLLGIAIRNSR